MILLKEPGSEVVQITPPGEPLVGRAGRREIDVLDSRIVQHGPECADGFMEESGLFGSHAEPEQLHILIKGRSVFEDAAEGCRGIERIAAQAVHGAAESGHVSKGVQMAGGQVQGLIG